MNNITQITAAGTCIGCMACLSACPCGALTVKSGTLGFPIPEILPHCTECGVCLAVCPNTESGGTL